MKTFDTLGAIAVILNIILAATMHDLFAFLGWLVAALHYVPKVIKEYYLP